jgi:hypothetical protein
MRTDDKDILKTPRLRENPYSVPEGYFSTFKKDVITRKEPKHVLDWRKFGYGIVAAASFALLAVTGIRLAETNDIQEDIDSIDLLVFSDMSTETYLDLMAVYEEDELTEEEIIEYLINEETSLEHIEAYE